MFLDSYILLREFPASCRENQVQPFLTRLRCRLRHGQPASIIRGLIYKRDLEPFVMKFNLLDRIEEIELGSRITAVKHLRPEEEYLRDHFPNFPVMPGVLMLEAMFQACRWLLLESDGYDRAVVILHQVRNVKFTDFVLPGQELKVSANIIKDEGSMVTLKVGGTVNGSPAVSGQIGRAHV